MTARFGCNIPADGSVDPSALAAYGCAVARCPVYPDVDLTGWIGRARAAGMTPLLVLDSTSLTTDSTYWHVRMTEFRARYAGLGVVWQVGNEPDGRGESSWAMHHSDFNDLLRTARDAFGPDAYLVAGGLVSGNADWLVGMSLSSVNAYAVHPYGQDPERGWTGPSIGAGYVGDLLDRYGAYGKPVWITEYGFGGLDWPERAQYYAAMTRTLLARSDVEAALPFCWRDDQVEGFGLFAADGSATVASNAVRNVLDPGPITPPGFVVGEGIRALMAKRGDEPSADELYVHGARGQNEWSECMGRSGRLYRYVFSTKAAYSYRPEKS